MRIVGAALLSLAVIAASGRAVADPRFDRLVLDRVELEPSLVVEEARLRLTVSAIALQQGGDVIDIDPSTWSLVLGATRRKLPLLVGRFGASEGRVAMVVIVDHTAELGDVLPVIQGVFARELLAKLSPRAQVGVIGYAVGLTDTGKLGTAKQAGDRLAKLAPEVTGDPPPLADALERALKVLRKAKTPDGLPMRKLVILVGDGRDRDDDRAQITSIGRRAARDGVRIHSLAYVPPRASKGPLLNLGELSKQSLGTFRWVRTPTEQSWADLVSRLRREIDDQYVLTYLVDSDEVQGKTLSVSAEIKGRAVASNKLKVPRVSCGGSDCEAATHGCAAGRCYERQVAGAGLGWAGILGGIAGLLALLAAGAFLVDRRRRAAPPPPAPLPAAPPPPAQYIPPAPTSKPAVATPTAPPTQPTLLLLSGPRAGLRLPLHHGFVIGKAPNCHLVLEQDGFASSHHAMVLVDTGGNCTLSDRGSTNGTFVNGVRIQEMRLVHGMAIKIGSTELRFLAQ